MLHNYIVTQLTNDHKTPQLHILRRVCLQGFICFGGKLEMNSAVNRYYYYDYYYKYIYNVQISSAPQMQLQTEQVCFQFPAKSVTLSIVRSLVGRLFHKFGLKRRKIGPVNVFGMNSLHMSVTRKNCWPDNEDTGMQSSMKYGSARPCWHLWTSVTALKSIHWRTGNQCRSQSIIVL